MRVEERIPWRFIAMKRSNEGVVYGYGSTLLEAYEFVDGKGSDTLSEVQKRFSAIKVYRTTMKGVPYAKN